MHIYNLIILAFRHPTIKAFREVVVDVIYLAIFIEFASTLHIWMSVIQLGKCTRILFLYLSHKIVELVSCKALSSTPRILTIKLTTYSSSCSSTSASCTLCVALQGMMGNR
jgi:hypothetical protein